MCGNFETWGQGHERPPLLWHDRSVKEIIEYFDCIWIMDQILSCEEIGKCCADRTLDIDVDSALHMMIGAFFEGESKMLADTAEVNNPQTLEMHKSGLELWILLKYNFDRSSAFNVISILDGIR